MAKDIGRRRRIGDEPINVVVRNPIGDIEARALVVAGHQRSTQKIDASLEAPEIAVGLRFGEGLVAVVDRSAEEAPPGLGR
jgi:hypothetical protein